MSRLEILLNVREALLTRPQKILSDDNISARVFYSLMKQFKSHLNAACGGLLRDCEFEQRHIRTMAALGVEDLNILKLSRDMSIYNEQFPVTYAWNNGTHAVAREIGSIYEDKFIAADDAAADLVRNIESAVCDDCLCTNLDPGPAFALQLRTEFAFIVAGSVSLFGALATVAFLLLVLKTQCTATFEDRSGSFLFALLPAVLFLFLTSLQYVLVPSSALCLTRAISLSLAYTIFVAVLLSVSLVTFVVNPAARTAGHFIQTFLFLFIVGVQVPVLVYETLFRDDTLLTNKMLTDYGPKIDCTMDDALAFKLFIYPALLLIMQLFSSVVILVNHLRVKPVKIQLSMASLLISVINAGWLVLYFLLEKQWSDLLILVGLQANGFVVMLVVALPKIVSNFRSCRRTDRLYNSTSLLIGPAAVAAEPMPTDAARRTQNAERRQHPSPNVYSIPGEFDFHSVDSDRQFSAL